MFTAMKDFLIDAAQLFRTELENFNFNLYWDLREIMGALPHVRLKEGYTLDACMVGDLRNAQMSLYVYRKDSVNYYNPGEDHYNVENDVFEGLEPNTFYGGCPGALYEVAAPIPFLDGQVIAGTISFPAFSTVPPISDYLDVEFTYQSIWEALLLIVEAKSYLPHRWHGSYANGILVVDSTSLVQSCGENVPPSVIGFMLSTVNLSPDIRIDGDSALVT